MTMIGYRTSFLTAFLAGLLVMQAAVAYSQVPELSWDTLPEAVKKHVSNIRKACNDIDPEHKISEPARGIELIHLGRDRALLVDNLQLCADHISGGNCSNRGCDLLIWRQRGKQSWQLVFREHFYEKFVSIDRTSRQLKFIAASIYAGDRRCAPARRDASSGQSCDVLVSYAGGKWSWRRP